MSALTTTWQKTRDFAVRYAGALVVIGLSLVLTCLSFYWLGYDFGQLTTQRIGGDEIDTYFNSWALYQALENLLKRPFDLGYSPIYYGVEHSFAYTLAPYGMAITALPVYVLSGGNFILAWNLHTISTFVFTAWAAYALTRVITPASRLACIFAALMVAFAPFRYFHMSRTELLVMHWAIVPLICLHRLLTAPRLRWAIGLGISMSMLIISSGYLTMMTLVMGTVIAAYTAFTQPDLLTRRLWKHLALAIIICTALSAPFLWFRLETNFTEGHDIDTIVELSAHAVDWFSGSSALYRDLTPFKSEFSIFLGFAPLVLAYVAWRNRMRLPDTKTAFSARGIVIIYSSIVGLGYLLTLGPVIQLGGEWDIPSPYMLLLQFPGFSGMRFVSRYVILPIIGTAVLSAVALAYLQRTLPKLLYNGLFAGIALILLLELAPFNGHPERNLLRQLQDGSRGSVLASHTYYQHNRFYAWLDTLPDDVPIMYYPYSGINAVFTYYAALPYHDRPMLNGYGSFMPDIYTRNWDHFPTTELVALIRSRDIQYVIMRYDIMPPDASAAVRERLAAFMAESDALQYEGSYDAIQIFRVAQ